MPHTALNGGAKGAIIQGVTACAKVAEPAPYMGLCVLHAFACEFWGTRV
jgi:hypothetical protein